MKPKEALEKARWYIVFPIIYRGFTRTINWCDPETGNVYRQGQALRILKERTNA